jgi:signal transduction histidine kinase
MAIAVNRIGLRLDRSALRPASRWDAALAVVACLVYGILLIGSPSTTQAATWPIGAAAWLVSIASIAWRTRAAWVVFALSLVAAVVGGVFGGPVFDVAIVVALYTIGVQGTWRRAIAAWAIAVVVSTAATAPYLLQLGFIAQLGTAATVVVSSAIVYAVPLAIGLYLGTRRAYVRTLLERTAALERERDLLERERDLQAREAVAVERARIARELHDVVAHHVSVMVIQAGAAEGTVSAEDAAAHQALGTIAQTGREAMSEMRQLLGVLRSDNAGGGAQAATPDAAADGRAPQPGLENLPALAARMQEAGVAVAYKISGQPMRLPRAIELSAYRVVQEALTNTLRHAGPGAQARLEVRYAPHALKIEVTDDGGESAGKADRGQAEPAGHGIVGMRERVALFGGTLEAGPLRERGYRVAAVFPIENGAGEGAGTEEASE